MERLRSGLFLFLFMLLNSAFAQSFEQQIKQSMKSDPKLDVRLDSRHSFVTAENVKIFGIKLGLDYDHTIQYGIGFNYLSSDLEKSIETSGGAKEALLRYYTFTPYIEYIFYRDNRWELSIPLQLGFGSSYYSYESAGSSRKSHQQFIATYEPAITAQYRLLKYFGPNIGIGYRLMIKNNSSIDESFTAPVYQFGLKLFIEDLYKDIFKKAE